VLGSNCLLETTFNTHPEEKNWLSKAFRSEASGAWLRFVLAVVGLIIINPHGFDARDVALAILCGVIATPLAPIAKDMASALQAGVKLAQVVKR